jgi:hypothetical protein
VRHLHRLALASALAGGVLVAPAAASAATWAVVNADGSLARGASVVSTAQLSTGNYEVIFNKNVENCVFNAQVGRTDSTGTIGARAYVSTARRNGNPLGVFLQTVNAGGTPTPYPFHLQLQCSSKERWAVVTKLGAKGRGKHVSSTHKLSLGTYEVIFDKNVANCTYIATVGTGVGNVSPPGIVTVARRDTTVQGVFVQTYTTGGALADRAFHLQVVCGAKTPSFVGGPGTTFARGAHVTSVETDSNGSTIVHFDRTVAACSFVATPGSTGGGTPAPASVTTVGRFADQNGIYVQTMTTGGAPQDFPFQMVVQC